jgi:hypothetical protein
MQRSFGGIIMNDEVDCLREFLLNMGVRADVQLDGNHEKLIVIETDDFNRRRPWIEAWFTLTEQTGSVSYFRERLRGTE